MRRRLRRDRRLAAAQRAGQHGQRRVLGVDPPRRRGRHRPVDPRRPGHASPTAPRWPAQKIERVLTNDPGMGVIRHVDAGYELADEVADRTRASASRCGRATVMSDDPADRFAALWASLAPIGRDAGHRRLPAVRAGPRPTWRCREWFVEAGRRPRPDGRDRRQRQPVGLVGRPGRGRRRGHRQPPRLGAARRGVRRAARRRLRAARRRRAARARASRPARPLGGRRLRRGGGRPVRRRLPRLPAAHRGARPGPGAARCATATASRCAEALGEAGHDPAALGPDPRAARPASAPSSSCTSSRAARWSTRTRRSAWPARSGRTAAGGSTSPARPTTPAPPGWPTGATRC